MKRKPDHNARTACGQALDQIIAKHCKDASVSIQRRARGELFDTVFDKLMATQSVYTVSPGRLQAAITGFVRQTVTKQDGYRAIERAEELQVTQRRKNAGRRVRPPAPQVVRPQCRIPSPAR